MSTLTSASTLTEIQAAYIDSASYAEDGSMAKARLFVTACRILLLKLPKRVASGRIKSEVELDPRLIAEEMRRAQTWVAGQSAGAVTHVSLESFRD